MQCPCTSLLEVIISCQGLIRMTNCQWCKHICCYVNSSNFSEVVKYISITGAMFLRCDVYLYLKCCFLSTESLKNSVKLSTVNHMVCNVSRMSFIQRYNILCTHAVWIQSPTLSGSRPMNNNTPLYIITMQ